MQIPKFEAVEVAVDGALGRLTLTRPEALNPLGTDTLREIAEAAHFLDSQGDLKVVVVWVSVCKERLRKRNARLY